MNSILASSAYRLASLVSGVSPKLASQINAFAIGRLVATTRNRPHPWSTLSDHISWRSLTDRTYSARHLPAQDIPDLPAVENVIDLFRVPAGQRQRPCPKSTCLFLAFAQYLTDGFIRTMISNDFFTGETKEDRKRNTSNHEIDLCPLYGRTEAQTRLLRTCSNRQGEKGRLRSEIANGEEYPLRLFAPGGQAFNPIFADQDGQLLLDTPLGIDHTTSAMRETLFAVGGDRANAAPHVSMMNTLFLREHNRLADCIAGHHPAWGDDQVFDAARACVVVMFIKIVVEEYINHINSTPLKLVADASVAWKAHWNRPNWITAEFSLLYRWHSLVPETMVWGGQAMPGQALQLDNSLLLKGGLANAFADISGNRATELSLGNSPSFLIRVEENAVKQARENRIAPFIRYQEAFNEKPARDFADITPDKALQAKLRSLYGSVERMEFYIGLFAQPPTKNGPLPKLVQTMVAVDAFSQALTNPLMSEHLWGNKKLRELTFSREGVEAIEATKSLRDVLVRNSQGLGDRFVGMTRRGWNRE